MQRFFMDDCRTHIYEVQPIQDLYFSFLFQYVFHDFERSSMSSTIDDVKDEVYSHVKSNELTVKMNAEHLARKM